MYLFGDYFKGKKVLITGHTGFKGSWLTSWLILLNAKVIGISIDIPTKPSNYKLQQDKLHKEYFFDMCDSFKLSTILNKDKPDIIFHLAAQSLVQKSFSDPILTLKTNTIGTLSLLEAIKNYKYETNIIFITSDKVYENYEWCYGYRENDTLGGNDPYSISKSFAEYLINNYYKNFFQNNKKIKLAIARAGNVIGGGDWSKDRIIPDCFKAYGKNKTVLIRNPHSTRPWQHVLEPLSGYLYLAYKLSKNKKLNNEAFNFGPSNKNNFSVLDLIYQIKKMDKNFKFKIKKSVKDNESILLKLNCEKAYNILGWQSVLNFYETISFTFEWYNKYYNGKKSDIKNFTHQQINLYVEMALKKQIKWVKNVR